MEIWGIKSFTLWIFKIVMVFFLPFFNLWQQFTVKRLTISSAHLHQVLIYKPIRQTFKISLRFFAILHISKRDKWLFWWFSKRRFLVLIYPKCWFINPFGHWVFKTSLPLFAILHISKRGTFDMMICRVTIF